MLDGKAEFYSGNYSFYAVEKERRYQERLKQYLKEQAKIQQLEKAAEQMHLWAFMGNDALHKRAFSMESASSGCVLRRSHQGQKMDARFASRQFRKVARGGLVQGRTDDRCTYTLFSTHWGGGERIALIGENGTGKTTPHEYAAGLGTYGQRHL